MKKRVKKIRIKKFHVKNFIMLTIAGIINSIGITLFLSPVKLYDSGISGTAMLLDRITPQFLSLSIFLLILNIPLFLFGLKKQGKIFTIYAIYAVVIYSLSAWIINSVIQININNGSPLVGKDLLLCALFGGMISGIGSGIAIRNGGAMDGIEVMAIIFAKKIGLTVGTFVMVYNVILYIISAIILKNWTLPLYSIIAYASALKTIDFIVEGIDRAKCAIIITENPDEICKTLSDTFGSGLTHLKAKGAYSNRSKSMIYFIVNRYQVINMKDIIHEIDPFAYITISEVADVFSNNNKSN